MIAAVSRIPLPKTERYLYWVRVAKLLRFCAGVLLFHTNHYYPPPVSNRGAKQNEKMQ